MTGETQGKDAQPFPKSGIYKMKMIIRCNFLPITLAKPLKFENIRLEILEMGEKKHLYVHLVGMSGFFFTGFMNGN